MLFGVNFHWKDIKYFHRSLKPLFMRHIHQQKSHTILGMAK
jgi:hypothetical protein